MPHHWTPNGDISPRDLVILKERVANPTVSTRELGMILDEEYGISLSHNRINEILRGMAQEDIFRETILPDRSIFHHCLFRIGFHYPNFADRWEDTYWGLVDDPHVQVFFTADSNYQWQVIAQFRTNKQMERWIHDFFKEYGELVSQFHNTMLHDVHKFQTDAAIFDDILRETQEGQEYLAYAGHDG